MTVTAQELQAAEALGRLAARNGKSVQECPYEADGDTDQRTLAVHFVRAYVGAGGVVAVSHEEAIDEGEYGNPHVFWPTRRDEK